MQIVADAGADIMLPPEQMEDLNVHIVRQTVSVNGVAYRTGVDIQPKELYDLLESSGGMPITSQPTAAEFADIFKELAATDPEILCIPMSSGLSGSINAAQAGAKMVPEADITIVDGKTLSVALGWIVAAAARARNAGWPKSKILPLIARVSDIAESIYTLDELKYLIHGGRISHMKGLLATALRIRPIIGVEKVGGTYVQLGMARTFERAISGIIKIINKTVPYGDALRTQIVHAYNFEGAAMLRRELERRFECHWLPDALVSPVLGAHTGPTMTGVAYAPLAQFPQIP